MVCRGGPLSAESTLTILVSVRSERLMALELYVPAARLRKDSGVPSLGTLSQTNTTVHLVCPMEVSHELEDVLDERLGFCKSVGGQTIFCAFW